MSGQETLLNGRYRLACQTNVMHLHTDEVNIAPLPHLEGPEAGEGGVLGFFKHKELMPELEEVGLRLNPGEISDLVRSPLGFHILRILERKGGEPKPFAEVQYKIREEMIQAEAERKYNEWMKDLKSKAYIEIKL